MNIRPDLFKGPATKYFREELKEKLKADQDPIFVLPGDGGRILSYIFCESQEVKESPLHTHIRTLYLDDICVNKTARGQHVGRQLYDYTLNYAREHGYYNVTLHV